MNDVQSPTAVRCAIYLRSATGDRASLLEQDEACRSAAAHNPAWQIIDDFVFIDGHSSGNHADGHPGLTTLFKKASEKTFDLVLVATPDRLSRNLTTFFGSVDKLMFHGIRVHIATTNLDSRDPSFRNLLVYGMQYQEDLLRAHGDKVSRGHLSTLLRGGSVGGRCYGYRSHPVYEPTAVGLNIHGAKLTIVAEEAEVIRGIFDHFARGASTVEIARRLNDGGVPSPAGHGWKANSIRRILRTARYRGTVVWNKTRRMRNPKTGRITVFPRPDEQVIKVAAPDLRIVDDELAAKVNARLGSSDPK